MKTRGRNPEMKINRDHLIPIQKGHAVSRGWTRATNYQPLGITWHWTATHDLKTARKILGGSNPLRKGQASAHFCVGRSEEEGVDQYVEMQNRSWHCGAGQTLEIDGRPLRGSAFKGARATIGIEVVHVGYARRGIPAGKDWIRCLSQNGRQEMWIAPWPEEQIKMMIELGRKIVKAYPGIKPEHHHGHADLCPSRKIDVLGFPMARVLRGIYFNSALADSWTPYQSTAGRQTALINCGYNLGASGVDGDWGRLSQAALEEFQRDAGLVEDGHWTQWVSKAIYKEERGKDQ
jgi:N-acetyl-anhydromuramyl-L-alanine amidase AmpD